MIWSPVILIALFIITSNLVNGLFKMNINHLQPQQDRSNFNVSGYWKRYLVEQPLDHFDSNEKRTFNMTYHEILNFWQPNGPIYIYLEEQTRYFFRLVPIDYRGTFMWDIAKDTNGVMFAVACRYYSSKTTPHLRTHSLMEYYKFLSSKQELADLAHIIKVIKSDPKYKSSKVVVIGHGPGSGNLAAWSRAWYPELVDAALAASAPVLAKKDFYEYYEGVRYTFEKYGTKNCLEKISAKHKRYQELLKSDTGIEIFKKEWNICPETDFSLLENIQYFFEFESYQDYSFFAEVMNPAYIKKRCDREDGTFWSHHLDFINQMDFPSRRNNGCWSPRTFQYSTFTLPFWYQYCTEFGYFQTTSSEKLPFVHWQPMEYFVKNCKGAFGPSIEKMMDEGVARTNEMFGGRSPNVTKVVFTHGDMDPWHRLGVLRDLGPDAPVLIANGTSNAAIIYEDIEQRKLVTELIKKWIS